MHKWKVISCQLAELENTLNGLDEDWFVVQILESTANGTVPIVCKRVVSDFEEVQVKTFDEFRAGCDMFSSDEARKEKFERAKEHALTVQAETIEALSNLDEPANPLSENSLSDEPDPPIL